LKAYGNLLDCGCLTCHTIASHILDTVNGVIAMSCLPLVIILGWLNSVCILFGSLKKTWKYQRNFYGHYPCVFCCSSSSGIAMHLVCSLLHRLRFHKVFFVFLIWNCVVFPYFEGIRSAIDDMYKFGYILFIPSHVLITYVMCNKLY
jgi:hypothetical protein